MPNLPLLLLSARSIATGACVALIAASGCALRSAPQEASSDRGTTAAGGAATVPPEGDDDGSVRGGAGDGGRDAGGSAADGCSGDPCAAAGDVEAGCKDATAPEIGYACICSAGFSTVDGTCVADSDGCSSCGTLSIFAVDIGQGDATVVLGPMIDSRRRALVIDAGNRYPDGGAIVGALLAEQGINEVDYVVLSHFDGDHIGGFVTVSSSTSLLWNSSACNPTPWFPTSAIFDQGTDTNKTSSSLEWGSCVPQIVQQGSAAHRHVEAGAEINTELDLGGGYRAIIVAGDGYVIDRTDRVASVNTPNERSIAVLVSSDDGFDFLVTGDLTGRVSGAENALVEGALGQALVARGVDVEVLRAGHHGAANASAPEFLQAIAPEAVIISTGNDQASNYHHPRCETYASLADSAIGLVLQTELGNTDCVGPPPVEPIVVNGTIAVTVAGDDYTIRNYGTASPANGAPTLPVDIHCTLAGGCP